MSQTPGPWAIWNAGPDDPTSSPSVGPATMHGYSIAKVFCPGTTDNGQVNARLIAAAPELLEALEEIVQSGAFHELEQTTRARAAIAKARGNQEVEQR